MTLKSTDVAYLKHSGKQINVKVFRHTQTGFFRVVGNYGSSGGFPTRNEAMRDYDRIKRNALKRERNELLRDITGTSARAARLDMGLSSY